MLGISHKARQHLARDKSSAYSDWASSAVSPREIYIYAFGFSSQRTSSLIFSGVGELTWKGHDVCDGQNVTRDSIQMYVSELLFAVFGKSFSKASVSRGGWLPNQPTECYLVKNVDKTLHPAPVLFVYYCHSNTLCVRSMMGFYGNRGPALSQGSEYRASRNMLFPLRPCPIFYPIPSCTLWPYKDPR